jgi:hypothetical protein
MKLIKIFLLSFTLFVFSIGQSFAADVTLHLFHSKTCPHCHEEIEFLENYLKDNDDLEVLMYEISDFRNSQLFSLINTTTGAGNGSVPFTIIGENALLGFERAETTGAQITSLIEQERVKEVKIDPVAELITSSKIKADVENLGEKEVEKKAEKKEKQKPKLNLQTPDELKLPIFGKIDPKNMSLPLLTIVLGLVDGFNPCAMWSLMFLISLLLGMNDRKRMWLLGSIFILISGLVYYFFMAAWLNLFMFVGLITWVRILIGLVALGSGAYYLYDYYVNKTGECKVDAGGKKQKFFEKLKLITQRRNLVLAILGIVTLAFAVNLVELLCSAGLPAVYTQVLTLNNLPTWQYYLYLLGYILLYMLDDMIVFAIAMITLKSVGLNSKYARIAHLIGGVLLALIGLAMIFKPGLIMFG